MEEKILEILEKTYHIMPEVDTDLLETGEIDSFEIITIVMDIEDEFGIEIDPELVVADNFRTVRSIAALISKIKG